MHKVLKPTKEYSYSFLLINSRYGCGISLLILDRIIESAPFDYLINLAVQFIIPTVLDYNGHALPIAVEGEKVQQLNFGKFAHDLNLQTLLLFSQIFEA